MAKYYQLYMVVLTVVFIVPRTSVAQIFPGQISGQIIPRPIILGQDEAEQQQELFLIDESATTVDSTGIGSGSAFQFLPLPLLTLVLPMMAMAMMTMTSTDTSGTSVAPTMPVSVTTVPPTQATAQPTPCVPTNCPAGYVLLGDQTASPNCYFYSGTSKARWSNAMRTCAMTPGAYLWRPNTMAEASAVWNDFKIARGTDIWTGANTPFHDGNYVFSVDNGAFVFTNPPFGISSTFGSKECIDIELTGGGNWEWNDNECTKSSQYVCEVPRVSIQIFYLNYSEYL
ncbi:unnamed protein product [Mytilus coruscus]|uniref:C-type lectin domain-containing protein n=1 Tax=Mytilus coruscus TaxID=42192 RepID=A0A6J8E8A4_MYTCO|nr:unnamed protein product [Mytilus coruscus]